MNERVALPQHLRALGFERNPFPQTPDADCYFRTEAIEQQFAETLHCLKAGKGFVLLTGEVGTGKSTFLRCLMDDLAATDCAVSFVFNTFLQGRDLLLAINRDFGLAGGADMAEDIDRLNHYLIEQNTQGRCCVVVIDDAQNLDAASLELLRLLSNLETRQNKLVQIVLSGQPELLLLLRKNESRQLASRIVQHIELAPLSPSECARYISFRIARAGTDGRLRLNAAAQGALHRHARGNPRRLHLIMDRCLYGVAPTERREIDKALIELAARESGIARTPGRRSFKWPLIGGGVALAVGLAAWTGVDRLSAALMAQAKPAPAAVAPVAMLPVARVPAAAVKQDATQDLQACLQGLRAGARLADIQNGLGADTRGATLQLLAKDGLALSAVPAGMQVPDVPDAQGHKACRWTAAGDRWVLWRPVHLPFALSEGAQSEAVRWLQVQLVANNLYTAPVDGMAGWRTLAALNVFQRQHGVPAQTGVDAWTLFLLEHGTAKSAV
ncbi:AAA family ATPase [Rhodoferax ferrireducens]|uniref:AAA family ATPase n=1 Tax=Rhodoferax ferrireducens TaxID=192843 RepID=UPI000E0D6787|nr:ExeA family protein [Rhodoferax ferrireducens]